MEGPREQPLTDVRRDRDIVSQHEIQLRRRGFLGKTQPQQALQTAHTRFGIRREELLDNAEKLRGEDGLGLLTAQLRGRADQLEAAEPVLAVVPDVVEEDKRTVRPSGEHRVIQVERLDDRVDIIRPQLRVILAVGWLVRETMTSHIQRDQSMLLRKARVHLAIPLEPTLRGTVDEEDRATLWVSRFHYMEVYAPTACHSVGFHRDPRLCGCCRRPPGHSLASGD